MKLNDLTRSVLTLFEGPDLLPIMLKKFPKLNSIISKYVNPESLKMIGRCSKGTAFSDGNIVIKITEDAGEALAAANMINFHIPGYVKTYEVGKFSAEVPYQEIGDDEPIVTQYYVIIQDHLDTKLNSREKEILDLLGRYLSDKRINYPINIKAVIDDVYIYGYKKEHMMYKSPTADGILTQILNIMNSLWRKRGIELGDVKDDNIGKDKDGKLTIFDPGLSKSPPVSVSVI